MTDLTARTIFGILWFAFAAMRIYYQKQAGPEQRRLYTKREGAPMAIIRVVLALPFMVAISLYPFWPRPLAWAALPLPSTVRLLGASLMVAGLLACWWVNATLGRNFSGTLALRADHQLIQHGPYRWVRHPMYTSFLVLMAGMLLLTGNWFVGGAPIVIVLFVMFYRTPKEEAMMLERFGDEYREVIQRTGRFLPRRWS